MFLYRILVSFQIVSFFIPFLSEASVSSSTATPTILVDTFTFQLPSTTVTGSNSTAIVSMTTDVVTNTSAIQPTQSSSTPVTVSSSSVATPTTPAPPSEGALQAVVLSVAGMTIGEFEEKKSSFISAVKTAVEIYCSNRTCGTETTTSRKRRATTVEQVYIVPGYPQQNSFVDGEILVALFVSTGDNKFLNKNILLAVVQEFRGNLSRALGKEITGTGRLHLDVVKTTESTDGSSGKSKILYIFFGVFAGIVLILVVCIFVTCWIGRKSETDNDVRPLTTSNLELVENQGGQRVGQR